MTGLFDTHCHLDSDKLVHEQDAVLQRAKDAGVTRIATIGCASSMDNVENALSIAKKHSDWIVATIGVHPHDAKHGAKELLDRVAEVGADEHVVAIGEMGLDFHYDFSPRTQQSEVFRSQIQIAKALKKPIIVHTREAAKETLEIMEEEGASEVGGIIHCFSEDKSFAKKALAMNFVSSFSGIVTFKSAKSIQDAAKTLPADAILVETDAPYLAPIPKRGKRNEPAFVAHTAAFVAQLRKIPVEELIEQTTSNALRVFQMSISP